MRKVHPSVAILAAIGAEKIATEAWESASKRTPEEERELMKNKVIEAWAIVALGSVGKLLESAKIKPIDCILTGDVALYLHGYLPDPPSTVNVFVKEHILDRLHNSTPVEIPFGFEATASAAILDTEPFQGYRLITIDQILKVIKQLPENHQVQYASIINDIESKINERTKTRDLDCVKAKDSKPAKKPKPKRDAYEYNPHAVSDRRGYNEEAKPWQNKGWQDRRRK